MTLFPWFCKFTRVPFRFGGVHRSRAQKLFFIYIYIYIYKRALALYVAWFSNYMQSSIVNKVIKDVDFYQCMHGIAECHVLLQVVVG